MTRDADHEGLRRIVYAIIDAQKAFRNFLNHVNRLDSKEVT
jgi:hypothetical protein